MRKYIARDIEVFCDNRAIEFFQPENKKKYALSIIAAADKVQQADKSGKKKKRGLFLYNGFSQNALKERVELLSKWKKVSALTMVTSVLIVTSVTSVFATTSNAVVDERQNDVVSQKNIDKGDIKQETIKKDNIVDRTDIVILTQEDVESSNSQERAAKYLVVRNYKYVSYGSLPNALDASIEQDGYTYKGILYLDDYVYESATDKYTGYYSGKLYR